MTLAIRTARASDLDLLVEIEEGAFDPALYSPMSRARFRHHLGSSRAVVIIAEADSLLVGYALCLLHARRRQLRFYSLAVAPQAQGGQAGRALFDAVEAAAAARGLAVQCEVREDNARLRERYERRGYRAYRRVANYYPDGAACVKYIGGGS